MRHLSHLEKSKGAGGLGDSGNRVLFGELKGTWQYLRNLGGFVIWRSHWGLEIFGRPSPWDGGGRARSDRWPLSRMELRDFLCHFNTVQICSLSPEVLGPHPAGGGWHIHTFQGRWVRGFNSGGSQPAAGEAWRVPERQAGVGRELWQVG